MKMRVLQTFVLSTLLFSGLVHANQCQVVFPDGASIHSDSGKIVFNRNARIIGSSDNVLDTPEIEDKTASYEFSCDTADCGLSGQPIPELLIGSFDYSISQNSITVSSTQSLGAGSYANITVREKKKLKFTSNGVYKIKNLVLEKDADLEVEDSVLWIETLVLKEGAILKYKGGNNDTTIINVLSLVTEKDSRINDYGNRAPDNILIVSHGNAVMREDSRIYGYVYAKVKVTMEKDSDVFGGVSAADIEMKEDAAITAVTTGLELCETAQAEQPLPDPIAYWPFDVCRVDGSAGELVDIVSGYNGQTVEDVDVADNSRFCQGLQFSGGDDHVNIPHRSAFALNEGAVSLWFKADDVNYRYKTGRGGQGLFSKDSEGTDNGSDHLTMWIDNNQRVFVRHQVGNYDNNIYGNTTIQSNQWYHVVYSWGPMGMRLYVNGSLENMLSSSGDISGNPEPIILGANAWVTGNGRSDTADLKDMFKGEMDEVQLFDKQLTDNNVAELNDKSSYSCQECVTPDPVLVAHWKGNVCTLDGSSGEIVDVINGINGKGVSGTKIEDNGKFCQAFEFNGDDAHINIPHADAFELESGTVSFWFRSKDLSHRSNPSHGGQGLFSKDSSGWNEGGEHLTIWLRDNGSIRVRHQLENGSNSSDKNMEAPSGSVQEDIWYHLVYTWGDEGMALYLNGELQDSDSDTRGIESNPEPIILGANAWITENYGSSYNLKDHFDGEMDDVRLYEGQLDQDEVSQLYAADNPDDCTECNPNPILESRWPFDLCNISRDENNIIDTVSGNNGRAYGDVDADISAVLCQGAEFDGDRAYVDIDHDDSYATEEGGVSLWFKVDEFASNDFWNNDEDEDDYHDNDRGQGHTEHGRGHGRGHDHEHGDNDNEDIQTLISKSARGRGEGGDFILSVTSNGELVAHYETDDNDIEISSLEGSVAPDTWYHATFTWGDEGLRLYLNGALVDSNTDVTEGLENNIERLLLGASGSGSNDGYSDHDSHDGHRHTTGRGHYYHGRGYGYGHYKDDSDRRSRLKRFLKGGLDDVRFYAKQQPTDAEVAAVFAETDEDCENCVVAQPELIAHYPSDVCSINGDGGTYTDIINGYNGTMVDGVTLSDGRFCSSVEFDGDDEHINIPHQEAFELTEGGVAFWIYVPEIKYQNKRGDNSRGEQTLFSKDSRGTDRGAGHLTISLRNDGDIRVVHQIGSSHKIESRDKPVTESRWHHIAYTWGPDGKRLYVDGDLKDSHRRGTGGIKGNKEPIIIGADASRTGDGVSEPDKLRDWFKGKIDDVRIYGASQPDDEFIEDLYETEYQCTECSNSLAHYKFEEANWTGSNPVVDSAGNFNGDNIGGISPLAISNPVSCQVMNVPFNDDDDVDALDTGIDPTKDIGDTGTISFWFKANSDWNGQSRVLFDASSNSKYFYANITSTGTIKFAFEDEDDNNASIETGYLSFVAQEWVHLAFTWNLNSPRADIYVNGALQATNDSFPGDFENEFGNLRDLYIGDSHGDYPDDASDNSANGQFDDVRIYGNEQSAEDIQTDMNDVSSCAIRVDHYELSFETPVSVCAAAELTVKACSDAQCSSLVNGTQFVDIQFVSGNTYTQVATDLQLNNGIATYDWSAGKVTTGTLQLYGENPAGQSAYSCDPQGCGISFQHTLEMRYDGSDSDIPTQIAQQAFSTNGQAQITVQNPNACGEVTPEPLLVAVECVEPAICSGNTFSVGGPVNATIVPSNAGAALNYVLVDSLFDGTATTLSNLVFNDAGRIRLHVKAGEATDSNEFVVKPSYLALTDSISNTQTAGTDFSLGVSAFGANGGLLPNYRPSQLGFSFARVLPANVGNDSALVSIDFNNNQGSPLAINDGSSVENFDYFDTALPQPQFSNGSSETFTARINEVGQFALDVKDADYLGVGAINSNRFGANPANMIIGRFIPAYFTAAVEHRFSSYCGDSPAFAYRGNPIATVEGHVLTLTAYNALNSITQYYDADVANYFYYNVNKDFNSRTYSGGGEVNSIIGAPAGSLMAVFENTTSGDGKFGFLLTGDTVTVAKNSVPSMPWMTGAGADQVLMTIPASEMMDNDGIGVKSEFADSGYLDVVTGPVLDGMQILDGRIAMNNIFGSDITQLTVILQTQYFSSDGEWAVNASDNCTSYDSANLTSLDAAYSISTTGSGVFVEGQSQQAGDGAMFIGLDVDEEASGEFDVEYSIPLSQEFLRFDWDGDGERGSPNAKIIFGINRGNDRIIHWREVY